MKDYQDMTLIDALQKSIKKHKKHLALAAPKGIEINYQQIFDKIEELSHFLKRKGISKGDKVAILSENNPHWAISFFSIINVQAVAVPILTDFHENSIHHILRHSQSKAVIVSEKFQNMVMDCEFENLKTLISMENFKQIFDDVRFPKFKKMVSDRLENLGELKAKAMNFTKFFKTKSKPDDPVLIIYTSGTSGHSKGVMLSHKNILFEVWATLKIVPASIKDRFLSILPLAHTYEFTLGMILPLLTGASVHYLNKTPSARVLIKAMKRVRPTVLLSVPLIMEKIYKKKVKSKFTSNFFLKRIYKIPLFRKILHKIAVKQLYETFGGNLKIMCLGGAKLHSETETFLKEGGFPYAIGYGLTETAPMITGSSVEDTRLGSCGKPLVGVEVKIENKDTKTGYGEIFSRGPNVMLRYFKDKAKTDAAIDKDGWFKTGDLGNLDEDNYLYITGRSKNLIIGASGENIYPEELENEIDKNQYVVESIVVKPENLLTAKVFLDYEKIDEDFMTSKKTEKQIQKIIDNILTQIKKDVNSKTSKFARLNKIVEHTEPFEKTPTKKIKRYLYK